MTAQRIFLDTQQWNYLVEGRDGVAVDVATVRESLKRMVEQGKLVVVGSLPLLQELMGAAPQNPGKYEQMRKLVFDVVGNHWLLPLDERYVREITYRGLLPETGRYVSRDRRRKIERLSRKRSQVSEIADATHSEVEKFKREQEHIRDEVLTELRDGQPQNVNMRVEMEKWWPQRDLKGWVKGVVTGGIERGRLPDDTTYVVSEAEIPSAWRLVDFKQARIRLNLGENRSIGRGDYADADIYGCSAYFDVLYTDDRSLRDTCDLLGNGALELRSFNDLLVNAIQEHTSRVQSH
jgi:hypothetical protein